MNSQQREFLNLSADTVDLTSRSMDYPSLSSILCSFMFTQKKVTRQEQSRHRPSNLNSLEQNKSDQKRIIPNRFLINVTISQNRKFKCKNLKLWNSWKLLGSTNCVLNLSTSSFLWNFLQRIFRILKMHDGLISSGLACC